LIHRLGCLATIGTLEQVRTKTQGIQQAYLVIAECALLTQLSSGIEEMAITAAITGDPTMVYRAICHDPLTAAVLSLAEIKQMTNELFARHKDYLPQFKVHKV
jgi:alpha-galactosidase/6-phospho-beta-glucosidase family protein